jgi:membrane-associated phospholipid phosphatase
MGIIMNIYDEVGSYGPNILILLSIYLLWDQNNLFFYYVIGIFIDSIMNLILKGIIQEPRPSFNSKEFNLALKNNKRFVYKDGIPFDIFGMPSGHSSSVIFSTIFIHLALRKTKWLYIYLTISAIVISQRVVYEYHTIYQVIAGAFVGALLAYVVYQLAEKKLKGRIREKPDDNGPI